MYICICIYYITLIRCRFSLYGINISKSIHPLHVFNGKEIRWCSKTVYFVIYRVLSCMIYMWPIFLLSKLGLGWYRQQLYQYVFDTGLANMIRIRYDIHVCTWLKVSKSRILAFNNEVNVLGWSLRWIQQILVLKQNDHLFKCICTFVYHSFIHNVSVKIKVNKIKLNNMLKSFDWSGIVFVFGGLSPSSISVQHDDSINTYGLISVSEVYR